MGVSSQLHALTALSLELEHLVPIGQEAEWASELVQKENKSHYCPCQKFHPDCSPHQPIA